VIVACSAGDEARISAIFKGGAVDYIATPYHSEEVLARIRTHLKLHHLSDKHRTRLSKDGAQRSEVQPMPDLMTYAVDNALDRIALIAPDGRFLYVNHSGYREMAYTREEILDMRVSDVDRMTQEGWLAHFADLRKARSQRLKTIQVDGEGDEHVIDVLSHYLVYEDKEYVCAFGRDVTEQERLTKTLAEYKHILDNIGNPIAMVDRDYTYRYVNPAYQKIFNLDLEKIIGRSIKALLGSETFETQIKHHYDECFLGKNVNYQMWYETPSLGPRLFDITYYPFHDEADEITAVVSNINDITEKYEIEKNLADKEAQLEAFLENIPAGVYIKNQKDEHVYVNRFAEHFTGKSPTELVGTTTYDFFDADTAKKLIAIDKKILTGELPTQTQDWTLTQGEKNTYLRDYKFCINLKSGEKILGGVAFDITELKLQQEKLQKAYDEINELKQKLEKDNLALRSELRLARASNKIIGDSDIFRNCLAEAQQVAKENTTVLILGETGVGKEILAQAIHDMSPYRDRAMIKVNCAALPANLIESELFGREKGAYTGALASQKGRFELAHDSTIFLDEIGDLPLELQSKLLRVLQEGTFEMLGSNKVVKVDVRVIAATNHDLKELVQKGAFRKDLFYRLNVFPITLPPLRERCEDIPLLAWEFVNEFNQTMGKSVSKISAEDLNILKTAEWPGNVRELRNIIERSMILSTDNVLKLRKAMDTTSSDESQEFGVGGTLSEVERAHILKTLKQTGWRVSGKNGAASILGLKPTTLEARMKKLGISRPS
jgi:PAS domain S-box-containing protein